MHGGHEPIPGPVSKRLNRFLVQIVRNAGAPKLNSNGVPLLLRPHYPSWGLWMRVHQAYSSALALSNPLSTLQAT